MPASLQLPHSRPRSAVHEGVPRNARELGSAFREAPDRSPNLNAYAERFVRSIRSECLAQVIPIGEAHVRRMIREYVEHYHSERNHQGIGNRLIDPPAGELRGVGSIETRERLGGLLRYYRRAA
ncbi:MAG: transposase [Deltaproteobacteria bacterium]|nr:MAG: transposase [Deltaproteobacteria bacterium]